MKTVSLTVSILCLATAPSFGETLTCRDERLTTKYEIRGNKLLGYEDDYSGRPNIYDILQNSRNGIIATRHSPDRLTWMTIDPGGKFVRKLVHVSGTYEESDSGYCTRK